MKTKQVAYLCIVIALLLTSCTRNSNNTDNQQNNDESIILSESSQDTNPIDAFFHEISSVLSLYITIEMIEFESYRGMAWEAEMDNCYAILIKRAKNDLVREWVDNDRLSYNDYINNHAMLTSLFGTSNAFNTDDETLSIGRISSVLRAAERTNGYRIKTMELFNYLNQIGIETYYIFSEEEYTTLLLSEFTQIIPDAQTHDTTSQVDQHINALQTPSPNRTFSSSEEAYYSKYRELAVKFGTQALHNTKYKYFYNNDFNRSYMSGVCVVNFIDFNGDGIQDLFLVYSNGNMERIVNDSSSLDVIDLPGHDTYVIEIWTFVKGELILLLREPSVSVTDTSYNNTLHRSNEPNIENQSYSITVFENSSCVPVIQNCHYDRNLDICEYENIYFTEENIVRDRLSYKDEKFYINDNETTWEVWVSNVAGFDKILLSANLAGSWYHYNNFSQDANIIGFNYTLEQNDNILSSLSSHGIIKSWPVLDNAYYSLYLTELLRTNIQLCEHEISEKVYYDHYYALYDLDTDGIPELILYEGSSGAGTHYHYYTV